MDGTVISWRTSEVFRQSTLLLVRAGAANHAFDCLMALPALNPFGLIIPGLFLYPHVFHIKEIRAGIMSEENYENEKQSCCCV